MQAEIKKKSAPLNHASPIGDRRTPVRLSLVVKPTSRWFSSRHLLTIKKTLARGGFLYGSDCRITSLHYVHCAHRLMATGILTSAFRL